MSTATKETFAASAAITITPSTLASLSAWQSASVDNSTNLYLDALVTATIALTSGTPGSDKCINVYAAGSEDGTKWPGEGSGNNDGVTGSDATIALENPTNLRFIGVINAPLASKTYTSQPFSVAAAFGGVLPRKWSVVLENRTGIAFVTGASLQYSGVYYTNS